MTVEGASDVDACRPYVRPVLGSMLAPGNLVVLDNVPAHNIPGTQPALTRRR
jgi:hypothetical protein